MTPYEQWYENVTDEGLRQVLARGDQIARERERMLQIRTAREIEELRSRAHARMDEQEKRTHRLQARAYLLLTAVEGVCVGAAVAAACQNDMISLVAMLAIGAVLALSWAIVI